MATPIALAAGTGYTGYFDCPIITPKIGTAEPDAVAKETIGGQNTDDPELSVIKVSPPFKAIQIQATDHTGGAGGMADFWSWIIANPSIWSGIDWGQVWGTFYWGGTWNNLAGPFTVGTGYYDRSGILGASGIYGAYASLWEWYDYGVNGPGTFDIGGTGTAKVDASIVLIAPPSVRARSFNIWSVSISSGSIGSYAQTNIFSGTLSPQTGPFLIPLPYPTTPDTPPYPTSPPSDLTDADSYNFVGVASFIEFV